MNSDGGEGGPGCIQVRFMKGAMGATISIKVSVAGNKTPGGKRSEQSTIASCIYTTQCYSMQSLFCIWTSIAQTLAWCCLGSPCLSRGTLTLELS